MSVYKKAVETYGEIAQIDMMIEEAAELIQALSKYKRDLRVFGNVDKAPKGVSFQSEANVKEELADNYLMSKQMEFIFGSFNDHIREKTRKLEFKLKQHHSLSKYKKILGKDLKK